MKLATMTTFVWIAVSSAMAGTYTETYTEKVIYWDKLIESVLSAEGMPEADWDIAKLTIAEWFYVGPCRGRMQPGEKMPVAVQIVMMADPATSRGRALLSIIGALGRETLGRAPDPDLCKFAEDVRTAAKR